MRSSSIAADDVSKATIAVFQGTHVDEREVSLEDSHADGRHEKRKSQDAGGDLVLLLSFARPRIDLQHQEEDVEGRGDVKDLEEEVVPVEVRREGEQCEVAGTEDETVE